MKETVCPEDLISFVGLRLNIWMCSISYTKGNERPPFHLFYTSKSILVKGIGMRRKNQGQKERELTQFYQQKIENPIDNTKLPPKTSITQGLRTDLGRSIGVTTAT